MAQVRSTYKLLGVQIRLSGVQDLKWIDEGVSLTVTETFGAWVPPESNVVTWGLAGVLPPPAQSKVTLTKVSRAWQIIDGN
jgi:hypothetical protein